MIGPRNEIKEFLLSNTKTCETLIEQTHTKAQETLEFRFIQSRETFSIQTPIKNEKSWMV